MNSTTDQTDQELQENINTLIIKLNEIAALVGPLLKDYGLKREEAEMIVVEMRRRGLIKEDV